jgi:hypothetical protein
MMIRYRYQVQVQWNDYVVWQDMYDPFTTKARAVRTAKRIAKWAVQARPEHIRVVSIEAQWRRGEPWPLGSRA